MDDKSVDVKFRNLAAMAYVMAQMDSGKPGELMKILESYTSDVNPWSNMAKEMMAFLAIKAGDKAKAKALYDELVKNQGAINPLRLAALKAAVS